MSHTYIGRQPIIDAHGSITAYELLYRERGHVKNLSMTAAVLLNLYGSFGIDTILGDHQGYVKVDRDFLTREIITTFTPEQFVFELFESVEVDDWLLERIAALKEEGYRFALNDTSADADLLDRFGPLLPLLECVKIDLKKAPVWELEERVAEFKKLDLKVIAAKIETHEERQLCEDAGCDFFQGYFIAKPDVLKTETLDLEHVTVLELWNLLRSDAPVDRIVKAFEKSPKISLKLIQFVNSAAFSLRNPVSSIRHVLMLLGRDTLAKWIMLLLFSEAQKHEDSHVPLLAMVVNRTELMSGLMKLVKTDASDAEVAEAYFVGMLSLIHLLIRRPIAEILDKVNVCDEIRTALLDGEGLLGEMMDMVRAVETFDVIGMDAFMDRYQIDNDVYDRMVTDVMVRVNTMEGAA